MFDLPAELLYTLQLKVQSTAAAAPAAPSPGPSTSESRTQHEIEKDDGSHNTTTACGLCGLTFADVQDQRSHVRSDLHGYNLKQKMRGRKAVTEGEFERLVGELDESISGSDSTDSEDDDEDEANGSKPKETTLSALLKRQAKITDGDAEDAPVLKRKRGAGKPPLIWFSSSNLPPNTSLGIYRAVFPQEEQNDADHLVEVVQRKQLAAKSPSTATIRVEREEDGGVPLQSSMIPKISGASGPHYFLCMIGGGHFAAMLVSLTPKLTKKFGVEDRSATVIAHKTFHRYTTRRKQGGSQSANDNAKGNAHSAGSSIRRYNEAALEQEVRDLLAEWKTLIDSAELLFIRATGSTNRRTLFGPYEGQVLNVKDQRIRGFPFNTRRATQSELMRAFVELTRVKVSTIDEAALAKQAEEATAAAAEKTETQINGKTSAHKPTKPSKEDEAATVHTTQLQALIRRSKAPALVSYLQNNKLSADFKFLPVEQNHHASTPLHLAAASNSPACVAALLLRAGADPTIKNQDGKFAFDIAGDRPTRDAFRHARSQIGDDRWTWDAANVPSSLSQSEVESRTAREKQEKAAEEEAEMVRRASELDRIRKEDKEKMDGAREKKFGKGHVVEQKMTAEERRMQDARGMSDDMRMRLEREKRARAAEERMRRLQGGG